MPDGVGARGGASPWSFETNPKIVTEWYMYNLLIKCYRSRNYLLSPYLELKSENKLIGWVDSDFGSDHVSRKSMPDYLMSLNGGAISWRSSRQVGVTLSSSEAEFVDASQSDQEVIYLRELLKGLVILRRGHINM